MHIDMRYPCVAKYVVTDGVESYTNGAVCGKAMDGDLTIEYEDTPVYGDAGRVDLGKSVVSGKLKVNVTRIAMQIKALLGGHTYAAAVTAGEDQHGETLTVKQGDASAEVGYGFVYTELDDAKAKHHYAIIVPRIVFASPNEKWKTKGKSTEYQAPSLEGDFLPKLDDTLYIVREYATPALALAYIKSELDFAA